MELFSEIYGSYYAAVARILKLAHKTGVPRKEIEEIVQRKAFSESSFHMLPKLFSGEWALLAQEGDLFRSKLRFAETKRPLSLLEKAWLRALLSDPRMKLFVSEEQVGALQEALAEVAPLYDQQDFHMADTARDSDPYDTSDYQERFSVICEACRTGQPLRIEYEGAKGSRMHRNFYAWKLIYSQRDNKFRLLAGTIEGAEKLKKATLNLARIKTVQLLDWKPGKEEAARLYEEAGERAFVVMEISRERNALERCMLQFASWEKETEYDEQRDCYTCRIYFEREEETELLIRILSFGPVVRVTAPPAFVEQIRQRIRMQADYL